MFRAELVFERVEDRFDPLAHAEQALLGWATGPVAGVAAAGADQVRAEVVEERLEVGAGGAKQ
ncbi:hypothetical protein FXF53_23665 [Micromonospora sp. WP24]|uniref:hypothetical protein n=1 Tax=Micromonospora sp. WP24 TaxID=2604469 RepID=UPI0011D7B5BF|nr:hypothetical protein [Micromonospora sp. WP24]TYB95862.1 hypothetical protein FXF53_23665 [Micromonospora sp. WP24]